MAVNKHLLQSQIEQTAAQLTTADDAQMVNLLLGTANALLKASEQILETARDKSATDEVYANYLRLASKVKRFYELYSAAEQDDEELRRELQKTLDEIQKKREQVKNLQSQWSEAVSVNAELQVKAEALARQLEEQQTIHAGLQQQLGECDSAVIEQQREENEALGRELGERKRELQQLEQQHENLQAQSKDAQNGIESLQARIADIPPHLVALREQYQQLEVVLGELNDAQTLYSPERREQLQQQIESLAPEVEENRVATEVLTNRLESLQQQNTVYDAQRHSLSTNLIALIEESMDELEKYLADQDGFVSALQTRADTVAGKLQSCLDRLEEYRAWMEVSQTPLDAMMKSLNCVESVELQKTLDVGQLPDIKQKFEQARRLLTEIDGLLSRCTAAVQQDLERIHRKAGD